MGDIEVGEIVVIDCWVSPFCMRVKIALNEKGITFENREEKNLMGGKSELLLASNPIHKKVPVLIHNGKPICESAIIVSYIDEAFPSSSPLLPSCAYARSQARFWTDFLDKKIFEAGKATWTTKGEELEVAKKEFIEILKQLEEGGLGDNDYFGGESFGFVDINAIGLASWFPAYEKFGEFEIVEHCPKLSAWINRCLNRPTVSQVIPQPEKVCEFVGMFRKMLGIVD